MSTDWRWLLLAAGNVLLLGLTAMVNDGLAPLSLAVFLAGPCVVWPALRLNAGGLLGCVAVSGLAGDALLPTPPGFLLTLFVLGAAAVVAAHPWLGWASRPQQLLLAWLLNGAYFAAFTVWALARPHGATDVFAERAAVEFCLSQILVLPVSLWFFAFQESVLRLARLPVAQEPARSR